MSVEVKLKGILFTAKSFPKLMTASDGLIVLFIREKSGTVIQDETQSEDWKIGEYSERFDMSQFKDYEGEITLRNE
jgi:hypothetical protein